MNMAPVASFLEGRFSQKQLEILPMSSDTAYPANVQLGRCRVVIAVN